MEAIKINFKFAFAHDAVRPVAVVLRVDDGGRERSLTLPENARAVWMIDASFLATTQLSFASLFNKSSNANSLDVNDYVSSGHGLRFD